jgi:uncharacterized protein
MAEFVLHVPDLDSEPKVRAFPIRPAWLEDALRDTDLAAGRDEGSVDLVVNLSGEDVVLQGSAKATLVSECARCLEPVPLDIEADLTTLIMHSSPDRRPVPDDEDATPEDLAREFYEGDRVILDEMVREHLILEVPMQVHCGDPECAARWERDESRRAADEIDPRFAALLSLKSKLGPAND